MNNSSSSVTVRITDTALILNLREVIVLMVFFITVASFGFVEAMR